MIFSDSLSALQSIDNLHWEHPGVCDVLELFSKSFEEDKCVNFCWIPSHIGICGNEHADFAAKTATKLPSCSCVVSFIDFKQCVNEYFTGLWQEEWDLQEKNKLHAVHPTLGLWQSSGRKVRRDEVVLSRIRVGHTYSTHSFLLKNEDPPICICNGRWTVKHILLECFEFHEQRRRYIPGIDSLANLFGCIDVDVIMEFLKSIGLYSRF